MILVRTPFRLPLGGGGTDLPAYYSRFGGKLVTAAINKYMYISLNVPAISDKIQIRYSKVEVLGVGEYDNIKHDIVRSALQFFKFQGPLEINSTADLSAGTGMGSSGSYTVGLMHGLFAILRQSISVNELAALACDIEMNWAKSPVGKQDQYAAAYGGMISMEIDRSGEVSVSRVRLEEETLAELENRLMLFYTNIQRDANEILQDQSSRVTASEETVLQSMHEIKEIGHEIHKALERGEVSRFGELMHEHWSAKKRVSGMMSTSYVDDCYAAARKAGALGGKIMGAGGGGFLVVCVPHERRRAVRLALEEKGMRMMPFRFDWEGSRVLANV